MGQGGKIKIENKTDSRMKRRYCKSYQMDSWSFPETIEANSSATVYVEWDECIFHAKGDDRGTVIYYLENNPEKEVHISLFNANERNFTVTRLKFNGISSVPQKVNWLHDGIMAVPVEEKEQEAKPENKIKEYDLNGPVQPSRWMGWLNDETPLNKINIPGTHDSLAYCVPHAVIESTAKTQKMDIMEQLNIGCRFLDIRINQNLEGRHGDIDCKDGMWQAMKWISSFLKENPKETILMRTKLESEDNVSILNYNLGFLFSEFGELFWRRNGKTEWPTLKEVRGKIVVLDNLTDNYFFFNSGYGFKYGGGNTPDMLIQDVYDPVNPNFYKDHIRDEEYKLNLIKQNMDIPFDLTKIKLNYVSAVTGWAGAIGNGLSPKSFADYLNPRVVECISNNENCYTGGILFDFIDENITKTVFSKNKLK
ncbi:phosphatidylinositol-specific phospholipase C domain-containing protein [Ruminococcus sp.]|uniref:phosphatidylinositol-specific phospholipase C domain-containing protein n=1 Tax=Ruminococcus sp. TaxID=41978 RepID=UPI0025DE8159|nr:phosphatidylinositol-specific phospholipase C domain-containing protein [Ruminococcus sp.]